MKKVALTALVLALGLAACEKKTETTVDNNTVTTENTVAIDTNAAVDAGNSADNALDAAGNT
ncbi:MAG: circumsporozoite protein, partial [Sphingomicrobium sp.]